MWLPTMPDPLHHSTMAAITRMAQARGLPIVRADSECVIVGDISVRRIGSGLWTHRGYAFPSASRAIRSALRDTPNA